MVKPDCVGGIVVPYRCVAARLDRIGADVAAYLDPTINLHVRGVHPRTESRVCEGDHKRTVGGIWPSHSNCGRAAIRPFGERYWWRGLGCRRPHRIRAATRRCAGITRRKPVPPFESVVAVEAREQITAEIVVETFVIEVRIAISAALHALERSWRNMRRLAIVIDPWIAG